MRTEQADPRASPQRISATACNLGTPAQSTEILDPGTRTPQRNPKTTQKALSGGQKGRVNVSQGFNRKLRASRGP